WAGPGWLAGPELAGPELAGPELAGPGLACWHTVWSWTVTRRRSSTWTRSRATSRRCGGTPAAPRSWPGARPTPTAPAWWRGLAGGASWLGVITVPEALALRAAGVSAPVLCLMGVPGSAHEEAVRQGVDLSAGSVGLVREIAAAARLAGRPGRLHLKVDTGMSRGGATARDWPGVVDSALAAEAGGGARVSGVWSHMGCADVAGHPSV